jgi:hypothetical protein
MVRRNVDAGDLRQEYVEVSLSPRADDRRADLGGERPPSPPDKQRLKYVVVVAVDQDDSASACRSACRREPGKAAANNDDALLRSHLFGVRRDVRLLRKSPALCMGMT